MLVPGEVVKVYVSTWIAPLHGRTIMHSIQSLINAGKGPRAVKIYA